MLTSGRKRSVHSDKAWPTANITRMTGQSSCLRIKRDYFVVSPGAPKSKLRDEGMCTSCWPWPTSRFTSRTASGTFPKHVLGATTSSPGGVFQNCPRRDSRYEAEAEESNALPWGTVPIGHWIPSTTGGYRPRGRERLIFATLKESTRRK